MNSSSNSSSKKLLWTYQKVSFLYLVFIVFFAFSTDSNYVKSIPKTGNTLVELNRKIVQQIEEYAPLDAQERKYKDHVFKVIGAFDSLSASFNISYKKTGFNDKWLTTTSFAKDADPIHFIRLENKLIEWLDFYPTASKTDLAQSIHLIRPKSKKHFSLQLADGKIYPNGSFPLLLEDIKSKFLIESVRFLGKELRIGQLINPVSIQNIQLLQTLKKTYFLGETIAFRFYCQDTVYPEITINNQKIVGDGSRIFYDLDFNPTKEGEYKLVAKSNKETIEHTFNVLKPRLRFLESRQKISALVGIPLVVKLDLSEFARPEELRVQSPNAEILLNGDNLQILAKSEGVLTLNLSYKGIQGEERTIIAVKPPSVTVQLRDITGDSVNIVNAHCLESVESSWQVIGFDLTAYTASRKPLLLKSKTRFFRNEMHRLLQSYPIGSTFVFNNIRLVHMSGKYQSNGKPFFFVKD